MQKEIFHLTIRLALITLPLLNVFKHLNLKTYFPKLIKQVVKRGESRLDFNGVKQLDSEQSASQRGLRGPYNTYNAVSSDAV